MAGLASPALVAAALLLTGCQTEENPNDIAPVQTAQVEPMAEEAAAAQEAAEPEAADPELEGADTRADGADDPPADDEPAAEGDEGGTETADASAPAPDDGQRPATVNDLMQGLAALSDAVDGVKRGENHEREATPLQGPRRHDIWTENEPPLTVEFHRRPLTEHMMSTRIELRSQADRLEVYGITLNRGHCGMAEMGQVNEGVKLPFALVYGRKKTINVRRCDRVLEAVVDTQYGEYTFRWKR